MKLFVSYLKPFRHLIAAQILLTCLVVAAQIINPTLTGRFIDDAIAAKPLPLLIKIAMACLGLEILSQIVNTIVSYITGHLAWKSTNVLRSDLTEHCLSLAEEFHKRHLAGEMIERIDGDVGHIATFLSTFISQIVSACILFLGILLVLLRINHLVAEILIGFVLLSAAVMGPLQKLVMPLWIRVRESSSQTYGFLEERLTGLDDIRTCGAKEYTVGRFRGLLVRLTMDWRRARIAGTGLGSLENVVGFVGNAMIAIVTAGLVARHAISVGTVYVTFVYMLRMFDPVFQIVAQVQSLQQALAGAVRIEALFNEKPGVVGGSAILSPGQSVSIAFEQVDFSYASGSPVLTNVTHRIDPQRVLGVVGRTGSGKTSLARLVFRLYDPTGGRITINDRDIKDYQLPSLRNAIGIVTQNVQLFHATVRDNLTFYDPDVADGALIDAIQNLGLGAWYNSLPFGLETVLDPDGANMSAGEAQLLALVRLFLKNPSIVILDEASSRMDRATEVMLQRVIERVFAGRTGIIIAHRLKTLEHVDDVMVLDDGCIKETGTYERLANDRESRFFELLQANATV